MTLRRIAVVQKRAMGREEEAEAYVTVVNRLRESRAYEVVEIGQLQQFAATPIRLSDESLNLGVALEAARRMELDGLLTLDVRYVEPDGSAFGSKSIRIGDPSVAAAIRYELTDARMGTVIDRNTVQSEFFHGEFTSGSSGTYSENAVLTRLARDSGVKLANLLAPHTEEVEVKLAHASMGLGSTKVREGVKAARQGDWKMARRHWTEAVREDRENDAALYNLGLAYEATGDYQKARQYYEAAIGLRETKNYQTALDRLQRAEADRKLAQIQIAGLQAPRNIPPGTLPAAPYGPQFASYPSGSLPPTGVNPAPYAEVASRPLAPAGRYAEGTTNFQLIPGVQPHSPYPTAEPAAPLWPPSDNWPRDPANAPGSSRASEWQPDAQAPSAGPARGMW